MNMKFKVNPEPKEIAKEGTVVTVMCLNSKHYVVKGGKEITCQNSGYWSHVPDCIKCGKYDLNCSFTYLQSTNQA